MKINDKFELASNGNPFDSILSLLTRNDPFLDSVVGNLNFQNEENRRVRISKETNQLRIEFLVPGWQRDHLLLKVEPGKLTLSSDLKKRKEEEILFPLKEFSTELQLPENLSVDRAKAKLAEGILSVLIPYSQTSKGKTVKIG